MARYRYRTCVLVGPWRSRPEEAVRDAVASRQARMDDELGTLRWAVPGTIEQDCGTQRKARS